MAPLVLDVVFLRKKYQRALVPGLVHLAAAVLGLGLPVVMGQHTEQRVVALAQVLA